jgi:hypothetical protein
VCPTVVTPTGNGKDILRLYADTMGGAMIGCAIGVTVAPYAVPLLLGAALVVTTWDAITWARATLKVKEDAAGA